MGYRLGNLLSLLVFFASMRPAASFAQALPTATPFAQISAISSEHATTDQFDALMDIIILKRELRRQVEELAKEVQKDLSSERQTAIQKKIEDFYVRIEDLDKNFTRMATGVDWQQFSEETAQTFDWQKELQDLFRPILEEMKQITSRREKLSGFEEKLPIIRNGWRWRTKRSRILKRSYKPLRIHNCARNLRAFIKTGRGDSKNSKASLRSCSGNLTNETTALARYWTPRKQYLENFSEIADAIYSLPRWHFLAYC